MNDALRELRRRDELHVRGLADEFPPGSRWRHLGVTSTVLGQRDSWVHVLLPDGRQRAFYAVELRRAERLGSG